MKPTTGMEEKKDTLFKDSPPGVAEDFSFSGRVAEVFDDMLNRSIPFYQKAIEASANLLAPLLQPDDQVVDLGCSNGTSLLMLASLLDKENIRYLGIDNSPAMLERAQLKAKAYIKGRNIAFRQADIRQLRLPGTGAFLLNYTLQFVRPLQRQPFLASIYQDLRPGGVLLLAEKTISHDKTLNRIFIDTYHRFKRQKGYSELEIAKKREALENILVPFSNEENHAMLREVGFQSVASYFQWFNFTSSIAIKPR